MKGYCVAGTVGGSGVVVASRGRLARKEAKDGSAPASPHSPKIKCKILLPVPVSQDKIYCGFKSGLESLLGVG